MTRRNYLSLGLVVIFAGCFGAGCAGKYEDYRELLKDERHAIGDFVAAASKAVEAEALQQDIEKLNAGLAELAEKIRKTEADRPESRDLVTDPPELKIELDELQKALAGLDKVLLDKEKLFKDPKVEKALKDLMDLRGNLGL